jgi:hypothetical protein
MRDMIIHTVFAFTLILLLPPVNDLCREYVAGPSASRADSAAAYHGSRYITGQYLDGYNFVRVGESNQAGWGKEYYYRVPNNNALRFKVVSVFYWSPDITEVHMLPIPRVHLGATYLLDRWDP